MYEWDTWDIVFDTDSLTTATFKQLFPKDVVPKKNMTSYSSTVVKDIFQINILQKLIFHASLWYNKFHRLNDIDLSI